MLAALALEYTKEKTIHSFPRCVQIYATASSKPARSNFVQKIMIDLTSPTPLAVGSRMR